MPVNSSYLVPAPERYFGRQGWHYSRDHAEIDAVPYKDEYGRNGDFHAFRHTYGTLGAKAGIPLVTMQKLMRHSDPKLTTNLYTHVLVNDKAAELAKLPAIVALATMDTELTIETG